MSKAVRTIRIMSEAKELVHRVIISDLPLRVEKVTEPCGHQYSSVFSADGRLLAIAG